MTSTDPRIDLTKLEKVRRTGDKIQARCPACAATGGDRTGNHLVILANGRSGCAAHPGDSEHRREIFRLVGIRGERRPDPERDRRWKQDRADERRRDREKADLVESVRQKRTAIIKRHRWDAADVWCDSPQRIDGDLVELNPRHFISTLFRPADVLWTGEVFESGKERDARRWKTAREWIELPDWLRLGPMISPATWPAGTFSRAAAAVVTAPFVVLDFDGFDGRKPERPAEIKKHVASSLALVRWIREGLEWRLAAIIWTGGKSVHAWFHTPPPEALESLRTTASALGVDNGLIGRGEHPARLPGQRHGKTGQVSRVLWLQTPRKVLVAQPSQQSQPFTP